MIGLVAILHGIACIFLILTVLMQGSKSEGLSGMFGGGGSGTLLGTGTRTFLAKVTTVLGIVFMITSLSLTVLISKRSPSVMEKSVLQEESVPADTDSDLPVDAVPLD